MFLIYNQVYFQIYISKLKMRFYTRNGKIIYIYTVKELKCNSVRRYLYNIGIYIYIYIYPPARSAHQPPII